MRRIGHNPGIHVANVIGDTLHEIVSPAIDNVLASAVSNGLKDRIIVAPPAFTPSAHELRCAALHECGHGMAKLIGEAEHIELRIRADGSGICTASELKDPEAEITAVLAGAFADIKFDARRIHTYTHPACSDFVLARICIDDLNASRLWPKLTYRSAAKTAMHFVDDHWPQIQNLALALNHSGVLCDGDIRLFAACVRRP